MKQASVGPDRAAFGMPFVQATLDEEGRLKAVIGAAGQKTLLSDQRWVDLFGAAGLPAALELNMPLWLPCHVPMCIAFETIAVGAERRGGGASWGEALRAARGVHESFRLIRALGYKIYPKSKRLIERSPASLLASTLWTMSRVRSFREVLATGKAEAQALVDVLVTASDFSEPPVDVTLIEAMKPY